MRRCSEALYPVLANAGWRMEELALARIADRRMAPVMRHGEFVPLLHATDGDVIALPRHEAVLMRSGRARCAQSRPCVRTRDSTVAIKTRAVAP
jgi:hypothetical protein